MCDAPREARLRLHWMDFPAQLACAARSGVVVYSRYGYGRSAWLRAPRSVRYVHDEALIVLPQFFAALGIDNPILIGTAIEARSP